MTAPSSNVTQAVPFFWVRDIEASIRFYKEGLGFVLTNAWIDDGKRRWCWLELGGAAVMLQEFWMDGPHRNLPDRALGVGVGIYFTCQDAIAIYRELKARGLTPQRPFVGNGMWVTHIADPDGYALYFESKTDAPEESELAEEG
jgi:catechol 2,3-dioxygenase-like lactoylglutathione lyase family enzyme